MDGDDQKVVLIEFCCDPSLKTQNETNYFGTISYFSWPESGAPL